MAKAGKKRQEAVAYLRVSSAGQVDGHGIERQAEAVRKWAAANGYELEREYGELAVSGTADFGDRPAFQAMVADLLANGCRVVLVESLDRLAREFRVQENILVYMASKGLSLIAVNTGENVTAAILEDPMRKALVQMQGIFAELDKSLLVRKLRKAREAKRARTGKCEGRKPFGAKDGEAETLAYIRQLRRKPRNRPARSFTEIAAQLNAENVPTRGGQAWNAENVRKLLRR